MASDSIHSLVSPSECKTILDLDNREDDFTSFLLTAATHTIENHLSRRLIRRTYTEYFDSIGLRDFILKEYPVHSVLDVHEDAEHQFAEESLMESSNFYLIPNPEEAQDLPATLTIFSNYRLIQGERVIKIRYEAGYSQTDTPGDLKEAVIELVAWNYRRYKSRRIGVAGSNKSGNDGDNLELTIPVYIEKLLEPYRRRMQ